MEKSAVIQVGIKAMRKQNGDFEKATPIFTTLTPKLEEREEAMIISYEKEIVPLIKKYIDAVSKSKKPTGSAGIKTQANNWQSESH